jgi:prepilin-type N-terminal cleavage/methylation domain-containing protein
VSARTSIRRNSGFSLVELAIVLIIVALLTGGLLLGVSAQRNASEYAEAQRQLDSVREALLGYAMANGRLPCPAQANLPSTDANAGVARTPPCDNALQHGVLPWATLGVPQNDPWGRRLTYYASSAFTGSVAAGTLASFALTTTGSYANIKANGASTANIASDLPAVVVSHGSRGAGAWQSDGAQVAVAGAAVDEAENADADLTFIARTPDPSFDDLVTWVAASTLKAKMVAAGRLP